MFKPKYLKEGKLLIKGVNRFLNYRRDLLKDRLIEDIEGKRNDFAEALDAKDKDKAEELAKVLTKSCEGAAPNYRSSSLAENVEVIFVAIAIALGIRAYIAQPFKIPTGSMQPTLNGIIAHSEPDIDVPNPVKRLWDAVMLGKVWENEVAKQDEVVKTGQRNPVSGKTINPGVAESTKLKFFTYTNVKTEAGSTYRVFAPGSKTQQSFGIYEGKAYKKGDIIARGWVDMGDHVIVDKFTYHFFPPRRGEVFVFTTKNIRFIETQGGFVRDWGSQHYIKRLSGVPGDRLSITEDGQLIVNGKLADSFGNKRVGSKEDGYSGYQPTRLWTGEGHRSNSSSLDRLRRPQSREAGVVLPEDVYVALGDNSYFSSDSRMWGGVPKDNLVGRALLVYWPFGSHWGPIW